MQRNHTLLGFENLLLVLNSLKYQLSLKLWYFHLDSLFSKHQIIKAQKILDSIDNVSEYFTELIKNYSKILDRFEYGIKSQIQKNILKGNKLDNGKINFRMMPIVHIQEFQALFNLSIVLYQMASLGYLSDAGEIKDEDIKSLEKVTNLIKNNDLVAA